MINKKTQEKFPNWMTQISGLEEPRTMDVNRSILWHTSWKFHDYGGQEKILSTSRKEFYKLPSRNSRCIERLETKLRNQNNFTIKESEFLKSNTTIQKGMMRQRLQIFHPISLQSDKLSVDSGKHVFSTCYKMNRQNTNQ